MSKLEKLNIHAYADIKYAEPPTGIYKLRVNPETYSCQYKADYEVEAGVDAAGATVRYGGLEPRSLSFDFYLDGTGVVPEIQSVETEIDEFRKLAYSYNGSIHSPNYLKIVWGALVFKGRLQNLDIEYLLFNPNGAPLRAKLKVNFIECLSAEEITNTASRSSPDLTHIVTVTDGDTLPSMCHRIYGNSKPYLRVAQHNNLLDFRNLKPGMQIYFPPLVD